MEKEQEVERERDRARSTRFFDSKVNFNEPPPKVSPGGDLLEAHCPLFLSLQNIQNVTLDRSPQE